MLNLLLEQGWASGPGEKFGPRALKLSLQRWFGEIVMLKIIQKYWKCLYIFRGDVSKTHCKVTHDLLGFEDTGALVWTKLRSSALVFWQGKKCPHHKMKLPSCVLELVKLRRQTKRNCEQVVLDQVVWQD